MKYETSKVDEPLEDQYVKLRPQISISLSKLDDKSFKIQNLEQKISTTERLLNEVEILAEEVERLALDKLNSYKIN